MKSKYSGSSLANVNPSPPKPPIPARLESNFLSVRRRGLVKLIRTEAESVMRDVKPGETFVVGDVVKRGVAESFSIYRQVKVRGAVKTTQSVPHHRVFANYFHARGRTGSGRFDDAGSRTLFLTDNENEFIAFTDGIEAKRAAR